MASNTDLVRNATPNFATTLANSMLISDVTLALQAATGLPTATAITLVIDATDPSSGAATPNLKEVVTGTLGGTTVSNLLRGQDGTSAVAHASGANVVMWVTANLWNDWQTAYLAGHSQLGAHIANLPLTSPKITTGINDANNVPIVGFTATASAVNNLTVTDAASGNDPQISTAGSGTNINVNVRGKGTGHLTLGAGAISPFAFDYVASGCVWSGDSYGANLNGSMTSGIIVIGGNPVTAAVITANAFTTSKDTYVDFTDNGNGTASVTYTEVANNAASPALAANSLRIGIIITGATNIAAATSVNQGQETMVLPIASSIPYAVTDSLGNLICPRDPNRKRLGYRQILTDITTTATPTVTDITGLSVPVIVPANRSIKIQSYIPVFYSSAVAGTSLDNYIRESSTTLNSSQYNPGVAGYTTPSTLLYEGSPSAGLHTYVLSYSQSAAGTLHCGSAATSPAIIMVELV